MLDHEIQIEVVNRLPHLLRTLTEVPGISGMEDGIARTLSGLLAAYADAVEIDSLASVIARFGDGSFPRVAVLAHIDTVGMLVKRVQGQMLGMVPVGGVNLKALPGAAVRVGDVPGVVTVRSQHQAQPGDMAVKDTDDITIDVGPGQAVEVATPVTYAPQSVVMGHHFAAPYLDDRAGCAALVELARLLPVAHPGTVYLVGTAQEETTCLGAYHALHAIQPQAAYFIDGTVSYDTPETRSRGMVALGQGPVLATFLYTSGSNGWHVHPKLEAHLRQIAAEYAIPIQNDAVHGLISDSRMAGWLGIPSAVIGLPMRGKHSPLEVMSLDDAAQAVGLLLETLLRPLPDLARG